MISIRFWAYLCESFEDFGTLALAGQANVQDLVQTTRSQHGRIDNVRPIGGGHQKYALALLNAVHFGQQLIDDTRTGRVL